MILPGQPDIKGAFGKASRDASTFAGGSTSNEDCGTKLAGLSLGFGMSGFPADKAALPTRLQANINVNARLRDCGYLGTLLIKQKVTMIRLSRFVISVPVFFGFLQVSHVLAPAHAAMNPEQATQLLSKSNAINTKCNVLPADKAQELRDFVARAEISLAEKTSVSTARTAIAAGRAQGKSAVCDDAARKLVNDVLLAANTAAAAEIADNTSVTEPKPQPQQAAVPVQAEPEQAQAQASAVAEPEPEPVVQKPAAVKPSKKVKPKKLAIPKKPVVKPPVVVAQKPKKLSGGKAKGLGTYAAVVEKYYVARRCGNMSLGQISALYRKVLSNHNQAMATNRARDVRAVLQAAEARAGGRNCG
jgi:hypothetical protein